MGKTLFLLASAINTEFVTLILDSCHSGGGTRGNCRVRSSDAAPAQQPSAIELAYQERWLRQLNLSTTDFAQQRNHSVAKGVVLASAQPEQRAYDATFNQFDAGVFTCFLTQYLWQASGSVTTAIASTNRSIADAQLSQNPLADIKAGSDFAQKPIYFVTGDRATPLAEAVIVERQGNRGRIWLGGVAPASLIAFDQGATFTLVGETGDRPIKLLSRNGLWGEVLLPANTAPEANLLQESARVIPADLKLRIGLDPSLAGDRSSTTAQQLLQGFRRVEAVPFQAGDTPYPGEVQYILSRMTPQYRVAFSTISTPATPTPPVNSIGLLSQSLDEVIPGSFGSADETSEQAIDRLSPKLTSLVAARILKLMLNANSSRLKVEAIMQLEDQSVALIGAAFTVRGSETLPPPRPTQQLKVGDPFQFHITNREPTDLYLSILIVDSTGELTVLLPNQLTSSENTTKVAANQTVLIPNAATDPFQFATEAKGIGEVLIIASRSPLRRALITLRNLAIEQDSDPSRNGTFVTPSVEAIADLLSDLSPERGSAIDTRRSPVLPTSEIAALSITFVVS